MQTPRQNAIERPCLHLISGRSKSQQAESHAQNVHWFSVSRALITPQHAVDQITKRSPVILSTGQLMFIDEQDVVLEAGVQMWLETEVNHDRVVMAVDMGVDTVQTLENLAEKTGESLGEGDTCNAETHQQ